MRLALSLLFLPILPLHAQDPLQQQQQLIQQQTEQQVQWQTQLNTQQTQQNIIDLTINSAQTNPSLPPPKLYVKSGTYPGTISVRLEDRRLPQAEIYYTTDGWTPTPLSTHYTGPITISGNTHLQAVAVLGLARSRVTSAEYTLPATAAPQPVATTNTTARIVFTAPLPSEGARIGDSVPLALAEDLNVDGLIIPKGTPVNGTVTHVIPAGWGGSPAAITFAVHSVGFGSRKILLAGTENLGGTPGADVPFHHGPKVTIPAGATLTATVLPGSPVVASK